MIYFTEIAMETEDNQITNGSTVETFREFTGK